MLPKFLTLCATSRLALYFSWMNLAKERRRKTELLCSPLQLNTWFSWGSIVLAPSQPLISTVSWIVSLLMHGLLIDVSYAEIFETGLLSPTMNFQAFHMAINLSKPSDERNPDSQSGTGDFSNSITYLFR